MSDNLLLLYRAQVVGTYTAIATEIELSSVARLVGQLPLNLNLYKRSLGTAVDAYDAGSFEVVRVTAVNDITNIATVIREQEGTTGVVIDSGSWEVFQSVNPKTISDKEDADATILKQADIINDLTTGGATKVLSAEQGVVLKDTFDNQFLPIGANPFSDTIIAPTIGFVEKGINPFIY